MARLGPRGHRRRPRGPDRRRTATGARRPHRSPRSGTGCVGPSRAIAQVDRVAARSAGADPGPGLGADDDDRSDARRRRVRRPRARRCRAARRRRCSGSSPSRRTPSSAPTSSATSRGPCCSTTSSSPPPRSPSSPSRPARSSGRATAGSRSIGSTSSRRPPRSPSATEVRQLTGAEILRHSLGLDGAPLRVDVRGHSWATDILELRAELPRRRRSPDRRGSPASCAATRPRPWRGSASSTRAGLGGCLALDMGLGKTPTVLAHLAGAHGVRTGARDRPGGGRRQLGGRGGALHPRTARRHPPRDVASVRRGARGRDRGGRRRHHHVRHRRPRHRRARRDRAGPPACSTRPRRSRTRRARPPSSCGASRRAPDSP